MFRFGVLGPAAAWSDETELELGTPQQRALFALLLLHRNEVVTTDRLVDGLWPSAAPPNALQVVRTYVSRLRTGPLDASVVVTRPHGYELRAAPGTVDDERFQELAAAARDELGGGAADRAEALLRDALALVRGPPLPELDDDQPARAERERLCELCASAAEELIEAQLAQGRHRELVPGLRAAVAAEPLRERTWGQLIVALYRCGRQADALAAYRDARRALVSHVGLEPGPQLRALERMVLLHDPALQPLPVGRLPRYRTSFLGRDAEVAAVTASLRSGRLVTITGPAGAGKTRLAAEVAPQAGRRVWWVDLDAIGPGQLVSTVARAVGVPEVPGRPVGDLVMVRLGELPALVVLDNCEHVLEDAARFAARLLDEVPDARALATSREPLHVGGETVHRLPGLSVLPASRLFFERAGPARVAGEEAGVVAELVARLDGLPLAIELAAGRLDAFSATELARTLGERLSVLGGGRRATPPRQRTLDAAIAWSYDLLTATEQRVLRRLAVFPASFDAAAADAVAGADVPPALARLVGASLLVADRRSSTTRYRLLWTVRAFARERLGEAGEAESTARRHRDAYIALAEELWPSVLGADLATGLRRAAPEQENFQAALRWSLDRADWQPAFRLAASLSMYWFRTGLVRDGRALLEEALKHAAARDPWWSRAMLGRAALAVATASPDAVALADDAVAACETAEDAELLALAHGWRARALLDHDRLGEARAAVALASRLAATAASEEALGFADQISGCIHHRAGDLEGAAALLERARDRYRRLRGDLDAGYTLIDLGRVRLTQGDAGEALAVAEDALRDFRRRDDPRGIAEALVCLGRAHARLGERERGRAALEEALTLSRRWGLDAEAADALEELELGAGVEALRPQRPVAVVDVLGEQRHGDVPEQLR